MPSIEFPQMKNVKYFTIKDVYLKADDDSVTQYCVEHGFTLVSYETENQRFSNDGALVYQKYDTTESEWVTKSGYDRVVGILVYS